MTVQYQAREALRFLARGKREAEGIGPIIVKYHDAPEWFTALCMDAHQQPECSDRMLPDDWRYEFIGTALDCIEEHGENAADEMGGWLDATYFEHHKGYAWLATNQGRSGYVDEYRENYPGADTDIAILGGLHTEAREVFCIVSVIIDNRAAEED